MLQQYLPFTVLKLPRRSITPPLGLNIVATVLTVYGIETHYMLCELELEQYIAGCNSTYRLRY